LSRHLPYVGARLTRRKPRRAKAENGNRAQSALFFAKEQSMARKSTKKAKPPPLRKAARPRHPDHKDEATTEDFQREGMGVAAKE